jgi:hypothetical protein
MKLTTPEINEYIRLLGQYNVIVNLEGEIELKHDALAVTIAKKRSLEEERLIEAKQLLKSTKKSKALINKAQLDYLQEYLPKLNLDEDEKEFVEASQQEVNRIDNLEKRRVYNIRVSITIFIILLIGSIGIMWYQLKETEKAKLNAEKKEKIAEKAKKDLQDAEIKRLKTLAGNLAINDEYDLAIESLKKALEFDTTKKEIKILIQTFQNKQKN